MGFVVLVALPVLSFATVLLEQGGEAPDGVQVTPEGVMDHIHGMGKNPADGTTYVATHAGLFRVGEDGPELVADRSQDLMGFTVTGPDTFLASGHPDMTDDSQPVHLGLIRSTDAGDTWQDMSLSGEADLHALDTGPAGIVAFDGLSARLMSSADGLQWRELDEGAVVDVAAPPRPTQPIMVTTPDGVLVTYDRQGQRPNVLRDAPIAHFVDWPRSNLLVAAEADGQLYSSSDAGRSWEPVGTPLGEVQAIEISEEAWLVARGRRVLRSTDEGRTWKQYVEFGS